MNKETLFRKHICWGCVYLEGYDEKKQDITKPFKTKGELVCGLPCNKDCPLQDCEPYIKHLIEFVKEYTKIYG